MQYYGVYPALDPTGNLLWNISLVDWIKTNTNYTQWTFNVKPGLKWSNGQNVTSKDILAQYSSTFGFSNAYDFTHVHNEVISEQALNSSAVTFVLNKSNAHFPETIGELVLTNVLPAANANGNYTGFGTQAVVVGPFYVNNYSPGQTEMVMLRNPYFYTTGLPEPKVCQLDINFVESETYAETYIANGATDFTGADPSSAAVLLTNPNVHLINEQQNDISDITWNVTAYPFNMTAFRQAMVYAVNESQMVSQAWAGYATPAYSAEGNIPPIISGLYNPNQMQYSYNTTTALSLLQSIGITKGSDGSLRYKNGTTVTLTLWTDNEPSPDILLAGIIQTNLASLGINVNLHETTHGAISSFPSLDPATMYLSTSSAAILPDPAIDALPGWDVYSAPNAVGAYWEYPPSIDAQYQSNLTAVDNTDNATLLHKYLNNIQVIDAQYLPTFVVTYGDTLFAYSTLHFTNWTSSWFYDNTVINSALFSSLEPVTATSTATTTAPTASSATNSIIPTQTVTSATTIISATTVSGTNSAPVVTTAVQSSSTGVSSVVLYGVVAVVIIIIAAAAVFMVRRRKP
jgi:ABC-type transport system substrate-binding protein